MAFDCLRAACLLALTVMLSVPAMAGPSAYVATTSRLELNEIQLEVVATAEFIERLSDRAVEHFQKAGLLPPSLNRPPLPHAAVLQLKLNPEPLQDACPGKVQYAPSLTLSEPVVVPRNGIVMEGYTWIMQQDAQVREPVTISQLEADLDTFVSQFIIDYSTANRGRDMNEALFPSKQHPTDPPGVSADLITPGNASLRDLRNRPLRVEVLADRGTRPLTEKASRQLMQAEIPVSHHPTEDPEVILSIELIQKPLEDQCPGKVLYESGLYLVEEVRIQRNPNVMIWSDTWLREDVRIVSPVSAQQLETDQERLLEQFIRSFQSR
ncbi:MAG TPA: hypothetical protein VIU63_03280 [Nitrospira sp.]